MPKIEIDTSKATLEEKINFAILIVNDILDDDILGKEIMIPLSFAKVGLKTAKEELEGKK